MKKIIPQAFITLLFLLTSCQGNKHKTMEIVRNQLPPTTQSQNQVPSLIGTAQLEGSKTTIDNIPNVLIIGDSLTQGKYSFAGILAKNPKFKLKVIAKSSMNTAWMKSKLHEEFTRIEDPQRNIIKEKPYNYVVIFGGTNYNKTRQEDLQSMYSLIQQYGAKPVGVTLPLGKFAQRDRPLNEWIKQNKTLYSVVDFATEKREDFTNDRIHLTAKKQAEMAEQLANQLTK